MLPIYRVLLGALSITLALVLLVACAAAAAAPTARGTGFSRSSWPQPEATSPAPAGPTSTPEPFPAPAPAELEPVAAAVPADSVAATGEGSAPADDQPIEESSTGEDAAPVLPPPVETVEAAALAGPRPRVIALDPGHGGPELGAAAVGLAEKDVNLQIALKLADRLRAEGYEVVLTRDTDRAVSPEYRGAGYAGGLRQDLQARVDLANAARADLFISIHNNGSANPDQSGTEVWYSSGRSFSDRNLALAQLVQAALVQRIRELGYPVVDRGIKDDAYFRVFRGRVYNIYVLGPGTGPREHIPTQMPAVLGESLFLSHRGDVAVLRQDQTLEAIAAGYRDAVVAYFEMYP